MTTGIILAAVSGVAVAVLSYKYALIKKQAQIWKEAAEEASEAIRRLDKLFDDYRKGCAEAAELTKTLHQREIDALHANHLGEMEEKQADVERYMEAARRLKEENDALKAEIEIARTGECVHCSEEGVINQDHWETCKNHPAHEIINSLKAELDAIKGVA